MSTTSTLTGLGTRKNRRGAPVLFLISLMFLLLAVGLFIFELIRFSQGEERLPANIRVAGVPVGGLSAEEAIAQWERAYAEPLVLLFPNQFGLQPIQLFPDSINFRIRSQAMVAQALASGETGGGFWTRFFSYLIGEEDEGSVVDIPIQADYQQNKVEEVLRDIEQRYNQAPGQRRADIETLTTFGGTEGIRLLFDESLDAVDLALRDPDNRMVILPVAGDEDATQSLEDLRDLIIDYLDSQGFQYDGTTTTASIFIKDLTTGKELNILGDVTYSAASTMKVPILIDYYRTLATAPSQEEAWLMVNSLLCSNNSSSNLIMQIVGGNDLFRGIQSVTDTAQYIGARNTYITAPFFLGVEGQELGSIPAPATSPNPDFNTQPDPFNQTTAEDMGSLFGMIYDCANYGSGLMTAYPDGEFNQNECRQMLEIMSANDLIRLLQGGIPADTRISHKNGWIFDTVGDAGIVYSPNGRDYIISVFLWEEAEFQDYEKLWPLVEEISRATWNHFNPESPMITPRTDLPDTAQQCEGNYLPPSAEAVNLNDIDSWKIGIPGNN